MAARISAAVIALVLCAITTAHGEVTYDRHGFQTGQSDALGKSGLGKAFQQRVRVTRHSGVGARSGHRTKTARSISLRGVTPALVAKTNEITAACGSVVVSAVAGRSNKSNHPRGRAVDLRGNPACIYAHLKGWPGGYSTDYATAPGGPHVHVSYNPGGQEWGLTFTHRKPGSKYAAHRRHRLANAL